jgi:thioredoxin reductase
LTFDYDVIIVGAGPAGLNAALLLARARRTVLLCDEGAQRNRFSQALHGFLTRDGMNPNDFRKVARDDLTKYESISFQDCRVVHAESIPNGFRVEYESDCEPSTCKKLLLATGVIDELPVIPGIDKYFGKSVFHCPYCDGFEYAGKRLCAYGKGENGRELALELLGWSDDVLLATNGTHELEADQVDQLTKCGITIVDEPITRLIGDNGYLESLAFRDGQKQLCDAMFFKTERYQKSLLAERLGCKLDEKGLYDTHKFESTDIPGMFVAGDASSSLHLVAVAAASGCEAAFAINSQLLKEQIKEILTASGK